MTEAEWLAYTKPKKLLDYLGSGASCRKLQLFACASCRRIWDLLIDERCQRFVDLAEQFADGLVSANDLERASWAANRVLRMQVIQAGATGVAARFGVSQEAAVEAVRRAARAALSAGDFHSMTTGCATLVADHARHALRAIRPAWDAEKTWEEEGRWQCTLLRDTFRNPFRVGATVAPSWLCWNDGAICKMAWAIYSDRRFADMPLLADALEDAGCDNADILAHCRTGGEHVRGCWVVDLLLGKT